MPYCIQCGVQNPDNAKYCSNCGTAIITTPTAQTIPAPQTQSIPEVQKPQMHQQTEPLPTQVPAANPASEIPTQQSGKNENFRRPATWGAILVIIGFFLPWERGYYSLSGLGIIKELDNIAYSLTNEDSTAGPVKTIITILICSIPVAALLFLITTVFSSKISVFAKVIRLIPFIFCILYMLLGVIGGATVSLATMGIGLIISLLGGACMLFLKKEY
jgi:zinc-ribbon domain